MAIIINNFLQLKEIELDMAGEYKLGANLDHTSEGYAEFTPIGMEGFLDGSIDPSTSLPPMFRGTLDGQGHSISDLNDSLFFVISDNTSITNLQLSGNVGHGAIASACAMHQQNSTVTISDIELDVTAAASFIPDGFIGGILGAATIQPNSELYINNISGFVNLTVGEFFGGSGGVIGHIAGPMPTIDYAKFTLTNVDIVTSINITENGIASNIGGAVGSIENVPDVVVDNLNVTATINKHSNLVDGMAALIGGAIGSIANPSTATEGTTNITNVSSRLIIDQHYYGNLSVLRLGAAGGVIGIIQNLSTQKMFVSKCDGHLNFPIVADSGGLVGVIIDAVGSGVEVSGCYGRIMSYANTSGGLVGRMIVVDDTSTIEISKSFSAAIFEPSRDDSTNIFASESGGFLGIASGNGVVTISDCFCNHVEFPEYIALNKGENTGGFVGSLTEDVNVYIQRAYTIPNYPNLPDDPSEYDYTVGFYTFVGQIDTGGEFEFKDCYWCKDTCDFENYAKRINPNRLSIYDSGYNDTIFDDFVDNALTLEEMRNKTSFSNFNFDDVWFIKDGVTFPRLREFDVEIDSWDSLRKQIIRGNTASNIKFTTSLSSADADYSEMPNWQAGGTREAFFEGYDPTDHENYYERLQEYSYGDSRGYEHQKYRTFVGSMSAYEGITISDIKTNYRVLEYCDEVAGFFADSSCIDIYDLRLDGLSISGMRECGLFKSNGTATYVGFITVDNSRFAGEWDKYRYDSYTSNEEILLTTNIPFTRCGTIAGDISGASVVKVSDVELDMIFPASVMYGGGLFGNVIVKSLVCDGITGSVTAFYPDHSYGIGESNGGHMHGGLIGGTMGMYEQRFSNIDLVGTFVGREVAGGVVGYDTGFCGVYENININGQFVFNNGLYCAGIVGIAATPGITMRNVHVNGDIIPYPTPYQGHEGWMLVGGLVGLGVDLVLHKCSFEGNITNLHAKFGEGENSVFVGGLIGVAPSAIDMQECRFVGNIQTLASYAGGLIGLLSLGSDNIGQIIKNVYSEGSISGSAPKASEAGANTEGGLGGIIGTAEYGYANEPILINAWSDMKLTKILVQGGSTGDEPDGIGMLIGTSYQDHHELEKNCFYNIENLSNTNSTKPRVYSAIGTTPDKLRQISTFANASWDIDYPNMCGTDSVWFISATQTDYPRFNWERGDSRKELPIYFSCNSELPLEQMVNDDGFYVIIPASKLERGNYKLKIKLKTDDGGNSYILEREFFRRRALAPTPTESEDAPERDPLPMP